MTLHEQKYRRGRGDGEGDASRGFGIRAGEETDGGDAFTGEGADGGELVGAGGMGGWVEELDGEGSAVFDGVFGHEGADAFRYGEDEFVGGFGRRVIQWRGVDRVCGEHDGAGGVTGPAGEALP